ncbi:MarR family winged helix-turn-helix transcriptional regulator [Granulicella cerasi]|uniref:MarR family winged helix-turn-helix transcriptional regulator n=1 Tax=Granulicella cerasi TaxID=741063 RepID=A0ABW1Z793_9BACT|nr:MarR family transcriptional regulator [Granulicella cerasi]
MAKSAREETHVWLVMMKAYQAIMKYSLADMTCSGLGDSDFRVLELLLHKGCMPVNTLGPKVGLTPGAISIAVDRLFDRELVTRVESTEDRRVRIVSLTASGRALIEPLFEKHAAAMARVFSKFNEDELMQFEAFLKTAGRQAEALSQNRN